MTIESLPAPLAQAIAQRGYEELTPVQSAVLTDEARGRDLLVSAQTGSGKTVAFGLAMAENLLVGGESLPVPARPLALVIAPTRELALQVAKELAWLYAPARGRIATCVGGMNQQVERRSLSAGTHIVVGTPGRLRDHLERGGLMLDNCKVVVLDEADEMLDMGFREDLEEILDAAPPERRTLMFSATMPKGIAELARDYQRDALRLATTGRASAHTDIAYQCVATAPADIESAVVNLLRFHEPPTALLFCATRDNVRRLHASLTERGFAAVALSGEHSQSERNQALQALRDRRARLCVATDVAARGIDLPGLSLVIHVEVPRDAETLQHRSGRTGRAGAKGTAVIIVPYPARRRVERMLQGAGVKAEWTAVPTAQAIAAQDHDRLLVSIGEGIGALDEDDKRLGEELMTRHGVDEIAAALVRMHRARLPQAEELVDAGPAPRAERRDTRQSNDAGRNNDGDRGGEGVWFRLDVGRRDNADPRWIIPLLCRRGGVTKPDIGAIRIFPGETMVEIAPDMAERFVIALKRHATRKGNSAEDQIDISPAGGPPQERSAQRPPQQRTLSPRQPGDGPRPPGGPRPAGGRPPNKPPYRGRP
ncbi:DEAD/DEAH box helicase [Sandarakinorhabdus sp.]|uniref:DEAD/DEAH box helicase n=1 Tax=Sandarakinorhabdus sp. TaxID=1916663 RepID=UPI00286E3880|nr:DEAD/DEAH box helicase [Sandarakinorhabdus sp.]